MTGVLAAVTTVQGRVAVRPHADCPIRLTSEGALVQQFEPGNARQLPKITLGIDNETDPLPHFEAREDGQTEADIVYSLSWEGSNSSGASRETTEKIASTEFLQPPVCEYSEANHCLAFGLEFLSIEVLEMQWEDGWLYFSFAEESYQDIQESVAILKKAEFDIDLQEIHRTETSVAAD